MSENASIFDQVSQNENVSAKHKWRGKLFFAEGRTKKTATHCEELEQDLSDFLRPSSCRASSKTSLNIPVPRLDISAVSSQPFTVGRPQIDDLKSLDRRRKSPRKEGLRVTFDFAPPDIIGEGGDEAELPVNAVSRSKWLPSPQILHVDPDPESTEQIKIDEKQAFTNNKIDAENDELLNRPLLQRVPTGFDDSLRKDGPHQQSHVLTPSQSDYSISVKNSPKQTSQTLSIPHDDWGSTSEAIQRAEKIQTPHCVDDGVSYPSAENSMLPSLDLGFSLANSLTPTSSSQEPLKGWKSIASCDNIRVPTHDYFTASKNQSDEMFFNQNYQRKALISKPLSDSRTLTLRSIAKNVGDDALVEFSSHVNRFNDIFRIGVTASSPLMEIPFVKWIRASAYWFLRGRGELETAVRGEGRNLEGPDQKTDRTVTFAFRQAYMDLAKAWWIVGEITPSHPDMKRFGSAGMSSLAAIVSSLGEAQLAETIGVHLAIVANMRALTMSMKRNNRMPKSSFEIQGLDSRVFIKSPILSSSVLGLLANRSQSLVSDEPKHVDSFFPIPLSDTKRHFLYHTCFVELRLSPQSGKHEEITIPCVLSVLRERTVWDTKAVIANQDGQVNIVIESHSRGALLWDDVRWKVKSHNISLHLSDNVDAQIQLLDKDFKSLWGIYDYTRKVQKSLQRGDDEEEVFNIELQRFQYFGEESSKRFPSEPIQGCMLRLFARRRNLNDSGGGRKIHDGHRLVVVTPPSVKTLSSINQLFGKQRPVLFSYLRDNGSAPALLLKILRPTSNSSMVMGFRQAEHRGLFHTLIDGTSISGNEKCSDPLALKNYTISKIGTEEFDNIPGESFTNTLRWRQLRVIDSDFTTSSRLISRNFESLRIWIEGEMGSFVDRMNFGKNSVSR